VFTLTIKEGPETGQQINLESGSLLIGRDPACNLVINDVEVSRRHARLLAQSDGYALEDLGSTNGTFVNEQRIKGVVPLKPGAVIRLGDRVKLVFASVADDEADTLGVPTHELKPTTTPRYMRPPRYTGPLPQVPSADIISYRKTGELLPLESENSETPAQSSVRRRPRRGGIRLPLFTRRWIMILVVLLILGSCAAIFFFWYVDANYLWCDVFGGLISACR
jgi:pSer/pThr/pTyr-binding forkhead associated (FHA) protein